MLPVSLDCFSFVFLRLVYHMLPVFLDCFSFVFLRLVYPMTTYGTQHEEKKKKNNPEKLAT
jgi:hypothetical protein